MTIANGRGLGKMMGSKVLVVALRDGSTGISALEVGRCEEVVVSREKWKNYEFLH